MLISGESPDRFAGLFRLFLAPARLFRTHTICEPSPSRRSRNSLIAVMVRVRTLWRERRFFGFRARPRHFSGDPRPRRGRHALAPRDPSDPKPLPTLHAEACGRTGRRNLRARRTGDGETCERNLCARRGMRPDKAAAFRTVSRRPSRSRWAGLRAGSSGSRGAPQGLPRSTRGVTPSSRTRRHGLERRAAPHG